MLFFCSRFLLRPDSSFNFCIDVVLKFGQLVHSRRKRFLDLDSSSLEITRIWQNIIGRDCRSVLNGRPWTLSLVIGCGIMILGSAASAFSDRSQIPCDLTEPIRSILKGKPILRHVIMANLARHAGSTHISMREPTLVVLEIVQFFVQGIIPYSIQTDVPIRTTGRTLCMTSTE